MDLTIEEMQVLTACVDLAFASDINEYVKTSFDETLPVNKIQMIQGVLLGKLEDELEHIGHGRYVVNEKLEDGPIVKFKIGAIERLIMKTKEAIKAYEERRDIDLVDLLWSLNGDLESLINGGIENMEWKEKKELMENVRAQVEGLQDHVHLRYEGMMLNGLLLSVGAFVEFYTIQEKEGT
jgi:hypothetical protein